MGSRFGSSPTRRAYFPGRATAGLDVQTRRFRHEMIRELKVAGTTVILATHDMVAGG